jgi:hypothetical protein
MSNTSLAQELSTVEATNMLNVSRPFLTKEMEAGRLPHHKADLIVASCSRTF